MVGDNHLWKVYVQHIAPSRALKGEEKEIINKKIKYMGDHYRRANMSKTGDPDWKGKRIKMGQ